MLDTVFDEIAARLHPAPRPTHEVVPELMDSLEEMESQGMVTAEERAIIVRKLVAGLVTRRMGDLFNDHTRTTRRTGRSVRRASPRYTGSRRARDLRFTGNRRYAKS